MQLTAGLKPGARRGGAMKIEIFADDAMAIGRQPKQIYKPILDFLVSSLCYGDALNLEQVPFAKVRGDSSVSNLRGKIVIWSWNDFTFLLVFFIQIKSSYLAFFETPEVTFVHKYSDIFAGNCRQLLPPPPPPPCLVESQE
ncbi:unnamed protein product [Dovyalis caffra]|uniref:Uncharacterized protein n=1 Tax=Dovyalis caffra TaxID=77055 RepID=A0AAV1QWY3_9ROSI|nr:unnamed protein product [Dovyalis caffra]